jgi:hypothetical protein
MQSVFIRLQYCSYMYIYIIITTSNIRIGILNIIFVVGNRYQIY